ncbi:AAA family ATPase [Myxococcus fulvus]|uniref:AAA family ATPase n=1 Tax=Myxococcus fulvus TaxID=33 RepID=UPI00200A89FF|nr:AAA family ATPase [Myxococcus fulvus]MCK8499269.1 AAA family ATPase [Myxococcus fulvus]
MRFQLEVQNYRALRDTIWLPHGVCALVGPNGAGKSTLLKVFQLLRHIYELGLIPALNEHGGMDGLRNFEAEPGSDVIFSIATESGADWRLHLSPFFIKDPGAYLEELRDSEGDVGFRDVGAAHLRMAGARVPVDGRSLLRVAADAFQLTPPLQELRTLIHSYRCYAEYHLAHLRENGSTISSDKALDTHGRNVFSVLRNWRDTRNDRLRYDFVIDGLRTLFPDVFADLDYETAGTTVTARVVTPKPDTSYPITFAPNGLLTALLHLCAVASVPEHGIVALDEVENSLHPYAIKHLVEIFRRWSAKMDCTVLLATHSPVVLDQFKACPEQVFVMERNQETNPMPLPEVRDSEYLSHFSLGDLYAHLDFGSPVEPPKS